MKLVVKDGKLSVEATRTELIRMAMELLRQAEEPERDFRYSKCCSATQFVFDGEKDGIESCSFSRCNEV